MIFCYFISYPRALETLDQQFERNDIVSKIKLNKRSIRKVN